MLSMSQAAEKSVEDSAEGITAEAKSRFKVFRAVEEPQRQDGDLALVLKTRVGTVNCLGPPEVEASSGWR